MSGLGWGLRGARRSQEAKKKPGLNRINTSQRCIGTRGVQANVLIENCRKSMNSEKRVKALLQI